MNVQGDKVRLGVIGCGMVCDSYLQTLRRFDHVAFAACADMEPERARRVAAEYGFARACSVDELVRGDDTDLVLNLTVPAAHAEAQPGGARRRQARLFREAARHSGDPAYPLDQKCADRTP